MQDPLRNLILSLHVLNRKIVERHDSTLWRGPADCGGFRRGAARRHRGRRSRHEHREQRSIATRGPRCVHERPRTDERGRKMGREPYDARGCGRRGCFGPSEACRMRRNDASSTVGSQPSGESRLSCFSPDEQFAAPPSRPGTGPPPWHRSSPLTVPPLRNLPPNAIALGRINGTCGPKACYYLLLAA